MFCSKAPEMVCGLGKFPSAWQRVDHKWIFLFFAEFFLYFTFIWVLNANTSTQKKTKNRHNKHSSKAVVKCILKAEISDETDLFYFSSRISEGLLWQISPEIKKIFRYFIFLPDCNKTLKYLNHFFLHTQ